MSNIERWRTTRLVQPDQGISGSVVSDEHAAMANRFLHHYAQTSVWMAEAGKRRAVGDAEGAEYAEQHAMGHSLHVQHIRDQMPPRMANEIQAAANRHSMNKHLTGDLDWIPHAMRTPVPADEVPINGGGLNGDFKWYPPGHPKHYGGN